MAHHLLPRAATSVKVRDALKARFDPIPVEVGRVPMKETAPGSGVLVPVNVPYVVLTPLWTSLDGPAFGADRHADAAWVYQGDLYATRGDQLEGMRDRLFEVFLGKGDDGAYEHNFDTPSVKITERELAEDNGLADPLGSVLPSQIRFRLYATPADTA